MAAYISFQPSDFYNTTLYTGTGSAASVTGVGFQPDLVWNKRRSATESHNLIDSVRGNDGSAYYYLNPDATGQQYTNVNGVTAIDSDGFSFGGGDAQVNASGSTYVNWSWKAGTTTGLSGGTITPTAYSINTTSGFGMYKYGGNSTSGATIAHGLGAVPQFMILKRTDSSSSWVVYHQAIGNTKVLYLDTTSAEDTSSSSFNNTSPTSTLFSLGNGAYVNNSSGTYIAYLWAEKKGYSKFGSYIGNGNADGTFIYTGFRPAYVMNKRTTSTAAWKLHNSKVPAYGNVCNLGLSANTTAAESAVDGPGRQLDLLSNGFKWRATDTDVNHSGSTYVYAAFGEFPIVSSNSKAGTAR